MVQAAEETASRLYVTSKGYLYSNIPFFVKRKAELFADVCVRVTHAVFVVVVPVVYHPAPTDINDK